MNFFTAKEVKAKVKSATDEIKKGTCTQKRIGLNGGLILFVRANSVKYVARAKIKGKDSSIVIGDYEKMKLSDAYNQVKIILEKAKNDELENQKTPFFKDYWKEYRAMTDKALNLSIARIRNKNAYYNKVLKVFDNYRLNEITPILVKNLTSQIETSTKNLKNCLNTLIACLEQARIEGIIETNKILGYTNQPKFKAINNQVDGYKWASIELLKDQLFEPLKDYPIDYKVYILLVAMTASRPGEIRELKWEKIDFTPTDNAPYGQIFIPNTETKTKRDSEHLDHVIPLTKPLLNILKHYRKLSECLGSIFLFPAKTDPNKPISASQMILPKNISINIDVHGLRKTANTFLVASKFENHFDEKDIDKVLSHKADDKIHKTYNKYDYVRELYRLLDFYDSHIVKNCLPNEFLDLVR